MIGLIDIGLGNQRSVANALEASGTPFKRCERPSELPSCSAFILPGVGSFADASSRLFDGGWDEVLHREVQEKSKPYLGICLGMQLLASVGYEHGTSKGLQWIEGEVEPIPLTTDTMTVPHMGWNDVQFKDAGLGLSAGLGEQSCFYFMHSFHFRTRNSDDVKGTTQYGNEVTACVQHKHIWGAQFHPEKSQEAGLQLLRNFRQTIG